MATTTRRAMFSALGLSLTFHAVLAVLFVFLVGIKADPKDPQPAPLQTALVYLREIGPGGGGGGNPAPAPPAKIEIPKPSPPAVVTFARPNVTPTDPPPPSLDAPVTTISPTLLGGGTNPFAAPAPGGGGTGKGLGPGNGDGLKEGNKRGTGGSEPQGGAGLTQPYPIKEVRPDYTGPAIQAKVRGSVMLEVEVLADGTVGYVKVLKSLDRVYGLDAQAVRAAKQWLFAPGRIAGKPVSSIVQLILDFNLR